MSASDLFNSDEAGRIGKLLGADMMIVGETTKKVASDGVLKHEYTMDLRAFRTEDSVIAFTVNATCHSRGETTPEKLAKAVLRKIDAAVQ